MTAAPESVDLKPAQLFMSYARANYDVVQIVVQSLEALHRQVWVDRKLEGGHTWWAEILAQIRSCDAVVVAVSPALLESDAATKERAYARKLGKPMLPVIVATVITLPPDLAELQFIDYTNIGPMTGIQLASAVAALPSAPPLTDPLPAEPDVPVSYLCGLADRVRAPVLPLDEQLATLATLRVALGRPSEHAAAVELIQVMRSRRDLYHAAWVELEKLSEQLDAEDPGPKEPLKASPATSVGMGHSGSGIRQAETPQSGWYPDPSGRHQLRWFDGDWTQYASDFGSVVEDPNF